MAATPVGPLLVRDDITGELKRQLLLVRETVYFVRMNLMLEVSDSYTSYADLGRKYVLWHIFAAPQFSLQPKQWCFLVVGCLTYKGYFERQTAENEATRLRRLGYDVYVGGVVAYSTLGWFNDPLLNTMLNRSDADLVKLLVHELVHRNIYIRNDPDLNEALAETVAAIALSRWDKNNRQVYRSIEEQKNNFEYRVMELVIKSRKNLEEIYSGSLPDDRKLQMKSSVISRIQTEYEELKDRLNEGPDFHDWIYTDFNNAKIASVSTYRYLVPGLLAIYDNLERDISAFYSYTGQLTRCDISIRHAIIRAADMTATC